MSDPKPEDRTVLDILARVLAPGDLVRVKGTKPTHRHPIVPGVSAARVVKHIQDDEYQIEFLDGLWTGEIVYYSVYDLELLPSDSGLYGLDP